MDRTEGRRDPSRNSFKFRAGVDICSDVSRRRLDQSTAKQLKYEINQNGPTKFASSCLSEIWSRLDWIPNNTKSNFFCQFSTDGSKKRSMLSRMHIYAGTAKNQTITGDALQEIRVISLSETDRLLVWWRDWAGGHGSVTRQWSDWNKVYIGSMDKRRTNCRCVFRKIQCLIITHSVLAVAGYF